MTTRQPGQGASRSLVRSMAVILLVLLGCLGIFMVLGSLGLGA